MNLKSNLFSILIIAVSLLCLWSCVENEYVVRNWSFDEKTFNDASSDWARQDLKNYSFSYMIWATKPNAINGDVTVDNGSGVVSLRADGLSSGEAGFEDSFTHYTKIFSGRTIRLESIEDIFQLIDDSVAMYRTRYNKDGSDLISYEMKVEYDEIYHYPKYISEHSSSKNDEHTDRNGDWDGGLCVKITDFCLNK